MHSYDDLAHKLEVSIKTVRRQIKAEGIKPVDKDGKTLLFDDKALATLQESSSSTTGTEAK